MSKSSTRRIRAAAKEPKVKELPQVSSVIAEVVDLAMKREEAKERAKDKEKAARQYKVTVHRDTMIEYPELWMDVYVAGDRYEQAQFAEMFVRAACKKADTPELSDLVIFTGGDDVDPALYGELAHPTTRFDIVRDTADIELYKKCLDNGIPMVGICRGAQFLHVMNGGALYQHVDNHGREHPMYEYETKLLIDRISSVHHQMCIPNPKGGMKIIAGTNRAKNRWRNPTENDEGNRIDIEAFFYRDTLSLGFQGHPEYKGYPRYTKWFLDKLMEFIVCNPDVHLAEFQIDEATKRHYRRLTPEAQAGRLAKWKREHKTEVTIPEVAV